MDKNTLKNQMKQIRTANLSKRIGEVCECPVCGSMFTKKHIKHVYCGGRDDQTCKNAYNNFIRYNTVYNFGRFNELKKNTNNITNKVNTVKNKYDSFSFGDESVNVSSVVDNTNNFKDNIKFQKDLEKRLEKKIRKSVESEYEDKLKAEYNKGYNAACHYQDEYDSWKDAQFNGCV